MKEKQIEEMAKQWCVSKDKHQECKTCSFRENNCLSYKYAKMLYKVGYRKQNQGEWVMQKLGNPTCSFCGKYNYGKDNYCPHCGAKMG